MRRVILGSLIGLALTGCNTLKKKYDNPVFAAAPRRISPEKDSQTAARADSEEVQTVSLEAELPTADDLDAETIEFNSSVVATVNGAPVFASEIVERYGGPLQQARQKIAAERGKISPAKYQQMVEQYRLSRDRIIQQDLRSHIERRLLIELLKADMKADQIKSIEQQLDKQFEETELPKLKRELKVATKPELERELNKRDTSLSNIRNSFAANIMAIQYVRSNIPRPEPASARDIRDYYRQHAEEFEIEARVRWRQIQCSFARASARDDAEQKIRAARTELQRGQPFEAVARKYSDDPLAKDGGNWDWITPGSLADQSLEERLFELPLNQISGVIESRGAFVIVEVLEREEAGLQPFADVQNDIKDKIDRQRQAEAPKEFLKKVWDSAVIESKYDLPRDPRQA